MNWAWDRELPMMPRVDLHSQVLLFLTAVCTTTTQNSCVSVQASAGCSSASYPSCQSLEEEPLLPPGAREVCQGGPPRWRPLPHHACLRERHGPFPVYCWKHVIACVVLVQFLQRNKPTLPSKYTLNVTLPCESLRWLPKLFDCRDFGDVTYFSS